MNEGTPSLREEIRRRTLAVAKGVALAPFAAFGVLFIVMLPGGLGIIVVDWAFGTGVLALEVLVVGVLMIATVAGLWWAFAYGGIASLLPFGRFEPTLRASALAFFAVVSFTSLTALLVEEGVVDLTPDPASGEALDAAFEFYLWQLANTLPLVDIPGNLGWEKPAELEDGLGGLLVVLFTGFVIFPLIQLARLILAGTDVPFDVRVVRALSRHVGSRRIFVLRDRAGYGRAVVDGDVFIDVMHAVWNHDAAVQRIERLAARPAERRPRGYLLVVDAVAEVARERIEGALGDVPFAARLVVWRADQRAEDLTDAFDALEKRLVAA